MSGSERFIVCDANGRFGCVDTELKKTAWAGSDKRLAEVIRDESANGMTESWAWVNEMPVESPEVDNIEPSMPSVSDDLQRLHCMASQMIDSSSVCPTLERAEIRVRALGEELGQIANRLNMVVTKEDDAEKVEQFKPDPINPPHYQQHPSGVECIEIAEHMTYCLGCAVKYLWRAGLKGDAVTDLRKAAWYIGREIERLEKAKGGGT